MSLKPSNYDELQNKKDKTSFKNLTAVQKYIIDNNKNKTTPKREIPRALITSPSKSKQERPNQNVGVKAQSKLPISVQKQTKNSNVNSEQIKTIEKSSSLPPKPSNDLQPLSSPSSLSSSSEDEDLVRLNEMLERFRSNKPTSPRFKYKKNYDWNHSNDKNENDQNEETEDETSNNNDNETDIANLKNRLNNLREKLFKNFDYNDEDGDSFENNYLSKNQKNEEIPVNKPPIQPKNKFPETKQPVLIETNNKFNTSNKSKTISNNINIESIDFKAKQLIEKSESSLTERLVSSDGLSSSRSTNSSMTSTLSSNFQETQPYKPEFLKYLENKSKLGHSSETGEALKPEDDILYQWRLRRKLEEAKKLSPLNEIIQKQELPKIINIEQEEKNNLASNKISETPRKQSIQTQTNNVCDSSVQTSLESINKLPAKSYEIEEKSLNYEKPTRDVCSLNTALIYDNQGTEDYLSLNLKNSRLNDESIVEKTERVTKHVATPKKSNFLASSPIRSKSRYLVDTNTNDFNPLSSQSLKSMNNLSDDLTRVSSINENTPNLNHFSVPKSSNSPICFNQSKLAKKPPTSSLSVTSSMTTVTASIDSRINQASPPSQLDQTVVISYDNSSKKNESKSINSNRSDIQVDDESDYIQKEMIDSDEILRILLKKTYYYRLKLKQIDELLTK